MLRLFSAFLLFTSVLSSDEVQPLYKYRYETDNVMKTAESQIPIHGYHVVEGGYYPGEAELGGLGHTGGYIGGVGGYGGKYIGSGPIGVGASHLGYGPGLVGSGIGLGGAGLGLGGAGLGYGGGKFIAPIAPIAPIYHQGYGGEDVSQKQFSEGRKGINDERFEKAHGQNGGQLQHGQEGFSAGKVAVKEAKGDSGYYNDVNGGKKVVEDGKNYHGAHHSTQEGKNGAEQNIKQGHKKGHIIKGFKTSHHKDETGKTEEYYDEENDEGGHLAFNGQSGAFGENSGSSFKGGHEDGKFNSGEQKKSGHYGNEYIVDKANADSGKYGQNKYAGNGAVYGTNNGIDSQSLLGHQEENRFFKHHPVPFYHHY